MSEKIFDVKVIPNAKKERIFEDLFGRIKIWVCSPAIEGRANKSVAQVLSNYLGVKSSSVELIRGFKSRNKLFRVKFK